MLGYIDWHLDIKALLTQFQAHQWPILYGIVLLWLIYGVNKLSNDLLITYFGLRPRTKPGLLGIVCAPLLHGHGDHFFFNAFSLYILAHFIALSGLDYLYQATIFISLTSGCLLWLFARPAIHIGASGVIMGYFGIILIQAYQHPSLLHFIIVFLCFSYLGGLISSLFNFQRTVSWEGHFLGFTSGLLFAYTAYRFPHLSGLHIPLI